jgi:nitroimidazol reductase NimA-like FMN-containing flavoprotein (pyridoxamine 5'-phosphate oxidase superfamily)
MPNAAASDSTALNPTPPNPTTPTRMPEKFANQDPAALSQLIADTHIGHFAFVEDDQPRVLPIAIAQDGSDILLHGSTGSHWLRLLATGIPVALSITALDALVVARSAFESSMHYRSAVLFGRCLPVAADDKVRSLDVVTEALIPGRVAEIRGHSGKELAATLILRMTVDDWTLKTSVGWPEDEAPDVAGPAWAGILPLATGYTAAEPTYDLRAGIALPASVTALLA